MAKFKSPLKILVSVLFALILLIFLGEFIFNSTSNFPQKIEYGVTFSPIYARYLGLNWQKTYSALLDDLKVRNLRIPGYWDILQPQSTEYDFSQTDYMLDEAGKRGARVMLVVGGRQPRWPECHIPAWAKSLKLQDRQKKALEFIQTVVDRYKDSPQIWAWQVENEPLLGGFGEGCDSPDVNFLKKEIELVKSMDSKSIIITDSGELGFWIVPMQLSDIFGTTLYRRVYDKRIGYLTYPVLPYFYTVRSSLTRIFAPGNKKTIITELQAEPWLGGGVFASVDEQANLFTKKDLENYLNFAQKTGFDEIYLWGVEWWYFMSQNGHPEYLEYAKSLFK